MNDKGRSLAQREPVPRSDAGEGFVSYNLSDQLGSLDPFLILTDFHMPQPLFPPHPHAGFSVATYLFEDSEGAFINRDSLGDVSRIEPGGLHWTQAGAGILHEEIPETPGRDCHGLQLWVNHSAANRMAPPLSYHFAAAQISTVTLPDGSRVRILVGESQGVHAPFTPITPITLLDVHLKPGGAFTHSAPPDHRVAVFVIGGSGFFGGAETPLPTHTAGVFEAGDGAIVIRGGEAGAQFLLAAARPLDEPTVFGGLFISTTQGDIRAAQHRFQQGEMGQLTPSPVFDS